MQVYRVDYAPTLPPEDTYDPCRTFNGGCSAPVEEYDPTQTSTLVYESPEEQKVPPPIYQEMNVDQLRDLKEKLLRVIATPPSAPHALARPTYTTVRPMNKLEPTPRSRPGVVNRSALLSDLPPRKGMTMVRKPTEVEVKKAKAAEEKAKREAKEKAAKDADPLSRIPSEGDHLLRQSPSDCYRIHDACV